MSEKQPAHNGKGITASRRTHRKSRLGCSNCKRRRIKCDEQKPECTNCVRHSIRCGFLAAAASSLSPTARPAYHSPRDISMSTPSGASTPSVTSVPVELPLEGCNVPDMELMHNYCTSTAYTIAQPGELQTFYRINVPQLGFVYPFVLHALLALSALHLAHFRRSKRAQYISIADRHWETGLRTAATLLSSVSDDNAPALYLFAIFSCFYTLAKGPRSRDFLLFGDNDPAEWFALFRGVRAVIETRSDAFRHGPVSPLFGAAAPHVHKFFQHEPGSADEHPRVAELRQLIFDVVGSDDPHLATYVAAVDDVSRCFACAFDDKAALAPTLSQTIFIWPYRISDTFVFHLQQRRPAALVIFTYFVVLLNELGTNWWLHGWVHHLLAGVHDSLDDGSRPWIRWPIEKLGWIPDV